MYQVQEMTYDEKVKMYSKSSKKELIQMLLENQRLLELTVNQNIPTPYDYKSDLVYSDVCPCNPKNGGSGICGCIMPNQIINK